MKSSSTVAQKPVRSNLCLVRQSAKCRNIFWPTYLSPKMLLRHVVTSFLVLIVPMNKWTWYWQYGLNLTENGQLTYIISRFFKQIRVPRYKISSCSHSLRPEPPKAKKIFLKGYQFLFKVDLITYNSNCYIFLDWILTCKHYIKHWH